MDFVDWCHHVLATMISGTQASPQNRLLGLAYHEVTHALRAASSSRVDPPSPALLEEPIGDALESLADSGLIRPPGSSSNHWRPTSLGETAALDPTDIWSIICAEPLKPDQVQLLRTVNRLSPEPTPNYVTVRWVDESEIVPELAWARDRDLLFAVATELQAAGLVKERGTFGPPTLHATYRGLVWETRRGFTIESRFIDGLVAEWETTSAEFKSEQHTDTADQKAELVKDVLGLANTQASGRRWFIIGFDDKTRAYTAPPDPKLTQNHLEQLLAAYTDPPITLRYEVVDYRAGPVGKLEVLRDATKLPYKVAKSIGEKKRIREGQVFVRHSSQTEEPTALELQAIHDEARRARGSDE